MRRAVFAAHERTVTPSVSSDTVRREIIDRLLITGERQLGIHTDAAVTWQRHAAGDWTTYAADISRRARKPTQ